MRMRAYGTAIALVLLVTAGGCRRNDPGDQETGTVTAEEMQRARANWPAGLAEQMDSGNAAFRERDFDTALRHYRRATEIAPDIAAAWFGIYMTEAERGNVAAADSAMARARSLAPDASLIHPTDTVTTGRQP